MASSKDANLLNQRQHNLNAGKAINSSNSLAFTSTLSSLINGPSSSSKQSSRIKPKKDDIFARPNRNTHKRAKRDNEDSPHFEQKHTTVGEGLDSRLWERSQRAMEKKARLYEAMKRGDVEDEEGKYGVDFQQKWSEQADEDIDDEDNDDDLEIIEFTDEFGRLRKGTRAEAARMKRAERSQAVLASDKYSARPSAPSNIIQGDVIQHQAFDPDAPIAAQMDELAKKRDKSATPPPELHFDGGAEVRSKGTGFFQFSEDEVERKRQMAELERQRVETERVRAEKKAKADERKRKLDERRAEIQRKRGKRKADEFLEGLAGEMDGFVGSSKHPSEQDERVEGAGDGDG